MNTKIFIRTVVIKLLLICITSAQFDSPGYGNGKHFQLHEINTDGSPKSILKKNELIYKLLATSDTEYKILKGDDEKIIDIKKGNNIYPSVGFLVDILEEKEKICLLMVTSQEYHYVEYVKKFPNQVAPENDAYLNLKLPYENDLWKPWRYVKFVPRGMDPLLLVDQIRSIKSIRIESAGNIIIENKEGAFEKYSVSDNHLNLDGKVYTPMNYTVRLKLESEFIATIDNATDEQLLEVSKRIYIGSDHQIKPEMNTVLTSMKNKEAADRIRKRILNLHKMSLNQK